MSAATGLDFGRERASYVRLRKIGTSVRLEEALVFYFGPQETVDDTARGAALSGALLRGGFRRARPRVGIQGRDAMIRYLRMPIVPPWRLRLLMAAEAEDLSEKAGESLSCDYRLLEVPEAVLGPGAAPDQVVLVALAKEGLLGARLAALAQGGLAVRSVLPTCVALFDAFVGLGCAEPGRTVLLLDSGPEGVELAIAHGDALLFARSLPEPPEIPKAGPGPREAQQLASAVASALQFCRTHHKLRALRVDSILLSGPYAGSPVLRGAIEKAVKVVPCVFDPLERASLDALPVSMREAIEGRGPELAIAFGLALADGHPRAIDLDLLPGPEKARREFASRTLWLCAAGVLLAFSLLFAGAKALIERSRMLSRGEELQKVRSALESRRVALEQVRAANRREIRLLDSLSRRTLNGAALTRLIDRLRWAVPARVTIVEVALDTAPSEPAALSRGREKDAESAEFAAGHGLEAEAALPEVAFRLRGEVDNASGEAAAILGTFEAALRDDPAISLAKVAGTPTERAGATLEFALAVRMRGSALGSESE